MLDDADLFLSYERLRATVLAGVGDKRSILGARLLVNDGEIDGETGLTASILGVCCSYWLK